MSDLRKEIKDLVAKYYLTELKPAARIPGTDYLPYGGRIFDEDEVQNLVDSSLDFWLTTGRFADQFESEFSRYLGAPYALLVNSGSSANLLAFMALTSPALGDRQIKRGDEVITVAAGFPTTVSPILQFGAVPVFIDVTIPSYNIDVSLLDKALSSKTKAIMIAHTLGNPFDVIAVKTFCDKHNLWLIEDNCDALGSTVNGKFTGTFGDIGTGSFYPPHHMTMGEGGVVVCSDPKLYKILLSMRDWGRDCICVSGQDNRCQNRFSGQYGQLPEGYDHKYVYSHFGYNLKVTDMQASIGCAQLKKLPPFIKRRQENHALLKSLLSDHQEYLILPEALNQSEPSWFGFLITVRPEKGLSRQKVVTALEKNKIQTRMLFAGNLIKHPCFDSIRNNDKLYRVVGQLNNTDRITNDTFWVGVYPGLTEDHIRYMAKVIIEAVDNVLRNCH